MKRFLKVYNQRIAGYLMAHNFPLISLSRDKRSTRDVYLFYDIPILRDCIDKWQVEKSSFSMNR